MSKVINLSDCFPIGRHGKRGPLPKQKLFLDEALASKYKFIRYSGGVGSGKTMIGCITLLHMAVLKRGDYLIGRQFMPELRSTTYKTFHDICPPELIVEKRVADAETIIRTVDGGTSTILFRGLEEPDKLRSLNLNAFYIDEAAQVSEAAFMLLQGRLRGAHFRKGIITQNPGGHDWAWRWFVKQDMITSDTVKRQFLNIRAPSTENIHLPDGYVDTMLASWSKERIEREIMGSDDTFEGMVYTEFDRSLHVVKPFRIPDDWTRRVGVDHGFRNPSAWVYGAMDGDGNMYIYREYYEKEKLIQDICKENIKLIGGEKIEQVRIDPSVKATRGATGKSDYDIYLENLPNGFPLLMAQNDVTAGIDRVKSYLKPDKNGKPRVYIFETCTHLIDEILQYRWEEQLVSRQGKVNEKEKPVKNNDHACFTGDTLVVTSKGLKRIDSILPGDKVLTRLGYHRVLASGITGQEVVTEYTLSNGKTLTCTDTHPIFDIYGGILPIGEAAKTVLMEGPWQSKWNLTELFLEKLAITIDLTAHTVKKAQNLYTEKFGSLLTDLYQKVTMCTIRTEMSTITTLPTLSWSTGVSTFPNTAKNLVPIVTPRRLKKTSLELGRWQQLGINPTTEGPCIQYTQNKAPRKYSQKQTKLLNFATFVRKSIKRINTWLTGQDSVVTIVKQRTVGTSNVYNLTVDIVPEFVLGAGIVVHNCDAWRYLMMTAPDITAPIAKDPAAHIKYGTIERALYEEIQEFKTPPRRDPFGE